MADVSITTQLEGLAQVESGLRQLANQLKGARDEVSKTGATTNSVTKQFGMLQSGLRGIQQELNRFTPAPVQNILHYLTLIPGVAGTAVAAIVALGGAFIGLYINLGNTVEQLRNTASRLSLTTEQVQKLQGVAKEAGIDLGSMESALFMLNRSMEMAKEGNVQLREEFDKLGIEVIDSEGNLRDAYDVLMELDKAMVGLSGPEKTLTGMRLMSRGFKQIMQIMQGDLKETADKMPVLGKKAEEAGKRADDAMDGLGRNLRSMKNFLLEQLSPAFDYTSLKIEGFNKAMAEGRGAEILKNKLLDLLFGISNVQWALRKLGLMAAEPVPESGAMLKGLSKGVVDLKNNTKLAQDQLNVLFESMGKGKSKLPAEAAPNKWAATDKQVACLAEGGVWDGKKCVKPKGAGGAGADPLAPLRAMRDELLRSIATFGMGDMAIKEWNLTQGELSKIAGKGAEAIRAQDVALLEYLKSLQEAQNAKEAQADIDAFQRQLDEEDRRAKAALNEEMKALVESYEDAADPMRAYVRDTQQIIWLMQKYGLSTDAARVAMKKLADDYMANSDRLAGKTKTVFDEIRDELEGFGSDLTDALVEGQGSLRNFFDSILTTFAKILTKKFIADPIVAWLRDAVVPAIENAFKTGLSNAGAGAGIGGGISGGFSSIFTAVGSAFGSWIGGLFGSGSSTTFSGTSSSLSFQHGGMLPAGFSGWVGESGRELLTPATDSIITPLSNEPVQVNVNIYALDSRSIAQLFYEQSDLLVGIVQRAFNKRGKAGIYD